MILHQMRMKMKKLNQVKEIFYKNKYSEINKWLLELDENYEHKNEMSKFMEYINDKLLMLNEEQNIINNNENNNENDNDNNNENEN